MLILTWHELQVPNDNFYEYFYEYSLVKAKVTVSCEIHEKNPRYLREKEVLYRKRPQTSIIKSIWE